MKVRDGFVSNSSSSSFVIVVREDADGRNIEIFKYALELATRVRTDIKQQSVKEYRDNLQNEIETLEKDIEFQIKRNKTLAKYVADKQFCKKLDALDNALKLINDDIHWTIRDQVRTNREIFEDKERAKWYEGRNVLATAMSQAKNALDSLQPELQQAKEKLKRLSEFKDDQVLYSFGEDLHDGGIRDAVYKMIADGKVVAIETVST